MRISYTNCTNASEAFEKVKAALTPELLNKVSAKIDFIGPGMIDLKGKGFRCKLEFEESEMLVGLDLDLFLKPFKGR